ncbi:acetamidase/formamidase family protein [Pseudoxanthomonas beigongshangi]
MSGRIVLFLVCLWAASASATETERWRVVIDLWGNPVYQTLDLIRDGTRLSGTLDGDPLTGSVKGAQWRLTATANDRHYRLRGTRDGDTLAGIADFPDPNRPERRAEHAFTATRLPSRPAGPPRVIDFTPRDYANVFSADRAPVLILWPGDTVRTRTLDSGGVDEHGVTRALFGNPQVGPFYVDTAEPGDVLVITLHRLRPNRDHADSLDALVGRAQGPGLAARAGALGKPVRWRLDRERGIALPPPGSGMDGLSIPLRPMLGGIAVAPGFGSPPMSTGDSGRFGGNMDFNLIVEGTKVHLPVSQPGALLYLGDAHAAQGDGETSQYALETSMDVEFSVAVIKARAQATPRVESATRLMAVGQAGSLDEAVRVATHGLIQWLQQDYGLSLSEASQLLGAAMEYRITTLAGRNAGVAAMLDKSRLASLRAASARR